VIGRNEIGLTQELHVIRAHLLHYQSLLIHFQESVEFVRDTPNDSVISVPEHSTQSAKLLKKECNILIGQIKRLENVRKMQDQRLGNVINLVFNRTNIEETKVAVRDSAVMKQIAFLTMLFFPATFVAGVFGMNVQEFNPGTKGTLLHYVATVVPMTMITIWVVVAVQLKYLSKDQVTVLSQLTWPWDSVRKFYDTVH